MNKDDILKSAQRSATRGQEYENKTFFRGDSYALGTVLFSSAILLCIEYFVAGRSNLSVMFIATIAMGVQFLHEGVVLHRKFHVFAGCLMVALAVIIFLGYIGRLMSQ